MDSQDFVDAYCLVCNCHIAPKRYQVPIPAPPPPAPAVPPSSPLASPKNKKGQQPKRTGLVNGTGRLRNNIVPVPSPPVRYRTVIDQGPLPLYCSDACHLEDLNRNNAGRPTHPERSQRDSSPAPPRRRRPSSSSESSAEDEQEFINRQYRPEIRHMAKVLNFPPLPDLSNLNLPIESDEERPPVPAPVPTRRVRAEPLPVDPTPELMNNFNDRLALRAESRLSTSPASTSSLETRKERSLVPKGAEGKLLVPDVKLKVRSSSSSSLSNGFKSPASSRRSVRSPLSLSEESTPNAFPLRTPRPAPETRSWSYDNVKTYPMMPLPTTTVRRKEKKIVDGQEVEVITEYEKPPQRLFLFPSPVRC